MDNLGISDRNSFSSHSPQKKAIFMTATPASLVCRRTENVHIMHQEVGMTFRSMVLTGLAILITTSFPPSGFAADRDAKAVSQKSPAQAIADFGVSDIEVQSVKPLDTGKFDAKVRKAAAKGEKWTRDAVLVALELVGAGLKGNMKVIDVRTPPEKRDAAAITVTESGYPDDAIGGERWRLWLVKGSHGAWTVQRALWAQLCARPGRTFYSAEKCP
jgi:hypothetical protein